MTGKRYYLTTLGDWKRYAATFANSHWIALEPSLEPTLRHSLRTEDQAPPVESAPAMAPILVLVEADEGMHGVLEDEECFESLPHPLSQKAISERVQRALASRGVAPGATTFDATELVSCIHPLLRHRVF